jgi:hypothetical protein
VIISTTGMHQNLEEYEEEERKKKIKKKNILKSSV